MRRRELELDLHEGQALAAALALSDRNPDMPCFLRDLMDQTSIPEVPLWRVLRVLERKGLLEINGNGFGIFVTREACRWEGPLRMLYPIADCARN